MSGIDIGPNLPGASQAVFAAQGDELSRLRGASPEKQGEAAERFQALFATMIVREIRRTLPNGFFGGGVGSDTFDSWLDDQLGQTLTESDSLGLAGMLKASISDLNRRDAS